MKILVSGGFDPLHYGHIKMMEEASTLGSLVVAVNSDEWLKRKKGFTFYNINERVSIIKSLKCVSEVVTFDDRDDTCVEALKAVNPTIFANGGDRKKGNTPEDDYCNNHNIIMRYGVGGEDKYNSSSEIAKRNRVTRLWGEYESIWRDKSTNIKKLYIQDQKGISKQRHFKRDEFWIIEEGTAIIEINGVSDIFKPEDIIKIKKGDWHSCIALGDCIVLEVQKGDEISEDDIERK